MLHARVDSTDSIQFAKVWWKPNHFVKPDVLSRIHMVDVITGVIWQGKDQQTNAPIHHEENI